MSLASFIPYPNLLRGSTYNKLCIKEIALGGIFLFYGYGIGL